MKLSIVTTLYCSAPYIERFYQRICAAAEPITTDFELVIVNDGSPDNVVDLAVALYEHDQRVRVIDLSRNFGHHKAMMTGLTYTQGDLVFFIDCDLEIQPETIANFYQELLASQADVVYGVQETRNDRWNDRLAGELFYLIFNTLSDVQLPTNITTARMMTRRYVDALVSHREREVLIGGLWIITGFKQVPLVVKKTSKGSTTYHVGRKIALIVNAITSFSNRPLIYIFYLGLFIVSISSIAALVLMVNWLIHGFLAGWASLIVSIWLLGGLTIFCIGIIGIYISKVFTEVKQRPYVIVRQDYTHLKEQSHELWQHSERYRDILQE